MSGFESLNSFEVGEFLVLKMILAHEEDGEPDLDIVPRNWVPCCSLWRASHVYQERHPVRWSEPYHHPAEVRLAAQQLKVSEEKAFTVLSGKLPAGWMACCTESGEAYYHHPGLGTSQWSHPGMGFRTPELKEMEAFASSLLQKESPDPAKETVAAPETKPHSVYDALSRHVHLDTPQSLFSDAAVDVKREDLVGRAFALHGLLSPTEAASYTQSAQRVGFRQSDVAREFTPQLRNNARLVHFSEGLASALYRRLLPHLRHRDLFLLQPMGFGAEGRWKPSGVNHCFRVSRYQPGEHFARHCDGMYTNDDGECSIYSLVIYLNDDYEGGWLEFTDAHRSWKPSAGSAVLFPHDMPHAATEVNVGTKYVARTELMFRCIERQRPPQVPRWSQDPMFERMAQLYEHIGDLVLQGDVRKTTEAYQEALGIQIAHQGTEVEDPRLSSQALFLEDKTWEAILSFLEPPEVLQTSPVSAKWCAISSAGMLWHEFFKQRWPAANEVIEGEAYGHDAELKDWLGLYRREQLLSSAAAPFAVIFPSTCIHCYDSTSGEQRRPMPAVVGQHETGVGWDCSFKQRLGWTVGRASYAYSNRTNTTWYKDGTADFSTLPELFNWAFGHFQLRPTEQHLIVPTLPGLFTRSAQDRLAKILYGRFQVPRLDFIPAPLCALAAHGLQTGAVVWGCAAGTSAIFCFHERELVGDFGPLNFEAETGAEVVEEILKAQKQLKAEVAREVLEHVVLSCQPAVKQALQETRTRGIYGAPARPEADLELKDWADTEELGELLKRQGLAPQIHGPVPDDVLLGAIRLRAARALSCAAVAPQLPQSWEWRVCVEGEWLELPAYISAVFEGALRSRQEVAAVQLTGRFGWYLVANLQEFQVALGQPISRVNFGGIKKLEHVEALGAKLGTSSRFQRAARLREVHKKAAAAKSKVDNLTSFFGKSEHVDDDEGPFCIFSDDSLYV
ncbi:unnamed protein product [Durusdinium trenchii]|uniref:Uncharacterized protein n=1 Tax=Durusdinium trenchii TaxID=1381693 RepID=A0ABP0MFT3_9DINO